jgi:hypothetical protein
MWGSPGQNGDEDDDGRKNDNYNSADDEAAPTITGGLGASWTVRQPRAPATEVAAGELCHCLLVTLSLAVLSVGMVPHAE